MKHLSLINILIILGLMLLGYLGYSAYLDNKTKKQLALTVGADSAAKDHLPADSGSNDSTTPATPENNQTAAGQTVPTKTSGQTTTTAASPAKTTGTEENKKGFYQNNTYSYQISFPEDWPIKVRAENNVSLGTVPPKSGQGAITIEITSGGSNELAQAQAEAKKYPGLISITEEQTTLAGANADKIIIENHLAQTKTVNILIKKNNLNCLIKYGEESPEFVKLVNNSLATFKFTK